MFWKHHYAVGKVIKHTYFNRSEENKHNNSATLQTVHTYDIWKKICLCHI